MAKIEKSEIFNLAYKFITETNKNVFLTGKAGTGKTTFLKYLIETSTKNIVVAAPTGVAAINAGGVTLHSLFQLPFSPFIPSDNPHLNTLNKHPLLSQIKLNSIKRKVLSNLDLLVIDEVSMVAANTLDAIDIILKSVRKQYDLPFGGAQVLFIGDLRQLPPVVKNDIAHIYKSIYKSPFFFDSHILTEFPPVMVELNKIYRQKEHKFIDVLNAVRENRLTNELVDVLNERLNPDFNPLKEDGYITLTTHNNQADSINSKQLSALEGKAYNFAATIKGDFPESMYPADFELQLKKGAQVMFIKNDGEEKRYFNGKIGIIAEINKNEIFVQCEGDAGLISVQKDIWKNVQYNVNASTREVEEEELGTFVQYPLRLAWAITIHKSQGLTFDKLVVDAEKAFANGQVYVALSRCRSLKGLVLTSPISQRFLGASSSLKSWEANHHKPNLLPELLEQGKIDCIRTELLQVFDWYNCVVLAQRIEKNCKDEEKELSPEALTWSNKIFSNFWNCNEVAKKFQVSIHKFTINPNFHEVFGQLKQRLVDAANYFLPQLEELKTDVLQHPLQSKTKKRAAIFQEDLEELSDLIHQKQHQLNYLQNGDFEIGQFLKEGKLPKTPYPKIKSIYIEKPKKAQSLVSAAEIEHVQLYQQIALYRKVKAKDKGVPIYRVYSNKAIKEMCNLLPKNEDDLLMVSGMGKVNVEMYGKDLVQIIVEYCAQNNVQAKDLFS